MKVISSQHYIDWDIVEKKMSALEGLKEVEIPCWFAGEIDDEEYFVQADGHHTLAAARELGIPYSFTVSEHPDGLEGLELLENSCMDGDWYFVEESNPVEEVYKLVW